MIGVAKYARVAHFMNILLPSINSYILNFQGMTLLKRKANEIFFVFLIKL